MVRLGRAEIKAAKLQFLHKERGISETVPVGEAAKEDWKISSDYRKKINDAFSQALVALEISPRDFRAACCKQCTLAFSQFMYLLVILGCELDLYGYALALGDYWIHGNIVMHIMLFVGPIGYIIALVMFQRTDLWEAWMIGRRHKIPQGEKDLEAALIAKHKEEGHKKGGEKVKELQQQLPHDPKIAKLAALLPPERPAPPVSLEFYHFTPILRYYLLIKEPESGDVEGLFRVNGLSTFTLGFAQMSCMAIGVSAGLLKFDNIFIKIGVIAQCVNLFNTLIYFGAQSTVVKKMKDSMKIQALNHSIQAMLQEDFNRYLEALTLSERQPSVELMGAIKHYEDVCMREIKVLSRDDALNLSVFSTQQLFQIRRLLWRKICIEFSNI